MDAKLEVSPDVSLVVVVDKLSKHSRARVNQMISGHGRGEKIGSGAFGNVYDFGGNRVFKVAVRGSSQYPSWITFCVNNKSKHFPKVSFLAHSLCEDKVYVLMEKLENSWEVQDFKSFRDIEDAVSKYLNGAKSLGHSFSGLPQEDREFFKKHIPVRSGKRLQGLVKEYGKYLNDLHTGNFMIRRGYGKKPTLVLTDPIA